MPGRLLSRGPATLRVVIRFAPSHSHVRVIPSDPASNWITRYGLSKRSANCSVVSEPSLNSPIFRINVPSLSITFCLVRWRYPADSVSRSPYRSSMVPSSARRPLGHQPPWGNPRLIAQSSAARSTPDWPPETILAKRQANLSGRAIAGLENDSCFFIMDPPVRLKGVPLHSFAQ